MQLTKDQEQQIQKLIDENLDHVDLLYYLQNSDAETVDELTDELQDNGAFDVETFYYQTAIEYLAENDNSLHESLELAHDFGFETNKLSSEILASLLATQNEREAYESITSELEEILFSEDLERTDEEIEEDNKPV